AGQTWRPLCSIDSLLVCVSPCPHMAVCSTPGSAAVRGQVVHAGSSPLCRRMETLRTRMWKRKSRLCEINRKQKTVKFHILRRKMTPPGAPQRKLTWEAMEQIRFLKQDQPQEWSVHRLAESFSVHPDVIRRVLGSKFVPPPERKMKQNSKVMAFLRQNELPAGAAAHQPRETLPGNRAAATAVLQSGSTDGALVPVAPHQNLKRANSAEEVVPSEEDEEVWDGRVFTEEELEELRGVENVTPPVQVGNEFFDSDGNLLYSI
uniref:Neugrin n=1 Tax=Gouania willdenowi TaxID=441366 RepID=A0A8C5HZG6_GOUWI